jgi:hypothetical protein
MRVENRLGYDIRLEDVEITTNNIGASGEEAWSAGSGLGLLPQGEFTDLTYTFRGERQPEVSSMQRMGIALTYYTCAREVNPGCEAGSEYEHTVSGRLTARVGEG